MIALTDDELNIVMAAARPLPVRSREGFLLDVAAVLTSYPAEQRGVGVVYRVAREMQRRHFGAPPNLEGADDLTAVAGHSGRS